MRCDSGRRLKAFVDLGHQVFAVAWASAAAGDSPSAIQRAELDALADETALLHIGAAVASRARRLWNIRRYPSYVAARIPAGRELMLLLRRIRAFEPDLIWLEGVHPSWLAWELKRELGIPLAYRSHNIEHRYLAEQARLTSSYRQRLALALGTWGLKACEVRLQQCADAVFDISSDDLATWRALGFKNGSWLMPQADPTVLATPPTPCVERDIDLLYLGGLASPNNLAGLRWYLREVHPLVAAAIPDIRLVIAGRKPPRELVELANANGATVIADPPDAAAMFARAHVMTNPILHGSGVNIKTIDMLATGRAVVTTAKGARGLPAEIAAHLLVSDDPHGFVSHIEKAIMAARSGKELDDRRPLVRRLFGNESVEAALATIDTGTKL
jgi:glycosyltransferase involved in cell wall biosynthesis